MRRIFGPSCSATSGAKCPNLNLGGSSSGKLARNPQHTTKPELVRLRKDTNLPESEFARLVGTVGMEEDRGVPFCSLIAASSLAVGWELLPGPLSGQCRHNGTFTR